LGADRRVFQKIKLKGVDFIFLKWLSPKLDETIEDYALRFSKQIVTKSPILIGLSFGGLLSIEIAKKIDLKKLIIISSVKTCREIPTFYKIVSRLGILKFLLIKLIPMFSWFAPFVFGTKKHGALLKEILATTDKELLYWSINQILNWQNQIIPKGIMHIHGSADKIFPIRYIRQFETVQGGGHLMILENAETIMNFLNKKLRSVGNVT
jgi:pimeloyl-ACP methyl ester carboxylesterase